MNGVSLKAERDHRGGIGCGGPEAERILQPYLKFIIQTWGEERAKNPDPFLDLQLTIKTQTPTEEAEILVEYRTQAMFFAPEPAAHMLGSPGNRPNNRDCIWCYLVREGQGCVLSWSGPKGT